MLATVGVGLSFLIAERTVAGFFFGVVWGVTIFVLPYFMSDIVMHHTIMMEDSLFYFRRCLALSLFTMTMWIIIFIVSAMLALVLPGFIFPDYAIIIGLFSVIPLRAVAIFSISRVSFWKRTLFTLVEPIITVLVVILAFGVAPWRMMFGLLLASLVGLTFAFALISVVEVYGRRSLGFSPNRMFRALLSDWLEGKSEELESYLNGLGVGRGVDVSAFAFRSKQSSKLKSIVLVSNFHPGPFTNIGSSVLPFLFQKVAEKRYGAIALVPHGLSGHELNLVSQAENTKIINWVLSNLKTVAYKSEATPVTRSNNGIATATSQVFDGCALVTMTTSPEEMEDVPSEVGHQIIDRTHGHFRHVALIDAHNCLTGPITMSQQKLSALQEAALSTLQISGESKRQSFKVGVSRRTLSDFGVKDGIATGGIAVLAIEVDDQRFAYIIIDGNNMIKGLREQILDNVRKMGFTDAEVMTTDSHMVNGVVHAPLGYRMVGEVVPWDFMINQVKAACKEAMGDFQESEVGVVSGQVPVTTLGPKSLRSVMKVVYRISKLTALTLFPLIVIVTVLSLLFLL
jgi:putative membrane protein